MQLHETQELLRGPELLLFTCADTRPPECPAPVPCVITSGSSGDRTPSGFQECPQTVQPIIYSFITSSLSWEESERVSLTGKHHVNLAVSAARLGDFSVHAICRVFHLCCDSLGLPGIPTTFNQTLVVNTPFPRSSKPVGLAGHLHETAAKQPIASCVPGPAPSSSALEGSFANSGDKVLAH